MAKAIAKADAAEEADRRVRPLSRDMRAVFTHMSAGNDAYSDSYNMFDEVGAPQTPEQARAEEAAQTEWAAAAASKHLGAADCTAVGDPITFRK